MITPIAKTIFVVSLPDIQLILYSRKKPIIIEKKKEVPQKTFFQASNTILVFMLIALPLFSEFLKQRAIGSLFQ